ncbi:HAD family hydrolase [Bacillaceae bacterium S4-13-58]
MTVDFDGTLYQGNSFKAMFQAGKEKFTKKQWFQFGSSLAKASFIGLAKGKTAFRHEFFKAFARTFEGMTNAELDEFFKELVELGMKEVHLNLVNQVRQHQEAGDTVLILSGTLQPFLRLFVKELDLDVHVISTELLFDENGKCTGEIGIIINGQEKVNKIRAWMDEISSNEGQELGEIWAYADSESDIPLLDFVHRPVVVNPGPNMKKVAEEKQWPIFA